MTNWHSTYFCQILIFYGLKSLIWIIIIIMNPDPDFSKRKNEFRQNLTFCVSIWTFPTSSSEVYVFSPKFLKYIISEINDKYKMTSKAASRSRSGMTRQVWSKMCQTISDSQHYQSLGLISGITHPKGWSFLQAFLSSLNLACAIPDIFQPNISPKESEREGKSSTIH